MRTVNQRCGFTTEQLEKRDHHVLGDCSFCSALGVLCAVADHGATAVDVSSRRSTTPGSATQRCALTIYQLERAGILTGNCPLCGEREVVCTVALHGATAEEVVRNRGVGSQRTPAAPIPGVPTNDLESMVNITVSPFTMDELRGDFMRTSVAAQSIPMKCCFVGYTAPEMNFDVFDPNLTHGIGVWMNGMYGGGEAGIIGRNDMLFSVYQHLASLQYTRYLSVPSTCTRVDLYDGIALVLVEENVFSLNVAVNNLRQTFQWLPHYARLPFIFGIAATTHLLEIYTLHEDLTVKKVLQANLDNAMGRWQCVLAAINVARALKTFIEGGHVIGHPLPFYTWHDRNHKRIRLDNRFVEVEYRDDTHFANMCSFYTATQSVPHMEHVNSMDAISRRIRLFPVGLMRQPASANELTIAITHVCDCLFSLHKLGYYHCDVRWANIVEAFSDWFLIDCELACHRDDVDTCSRRPMEIVQRRVMDESKPWNECFDLYQVGLLLNDCEHTNDDRRLVELRDLLQTKTFSVDAVETLVHRLRPGK